jgi:hypothetical protein
MTDYPCGFQADGRDDPFRVQYGLRSLFRNAGEQGNEPGMFTAGKTPSVCTRNLKNPLNTASDSSSLTVFLQEHLLHLVFSGCQDILAPDASMTLFLRLEKNWEYTWVA